MQLQLYLTPDQTEIFSKPKYFQLSFAKAGEEQTGPLNVRSSQNVARTSSAIKTQLMASMQRKNLSYCPSAMKTRRKARKCLEPNLYGIGELWPASSEWTSLSGGECWQKLHVLVHLEPGQWWLLVIIIKVTKRPATKLGNLHHHTKYFHCFLEIFSSKIFLLTWRYCEAAALGNWPLTGKFTSEV